MKVKQKTKKAMLNNNFNVETIVNKYRNFVKENSWWPKDEWDLDGFDTKTVASEQQLLSRLSHDNKEVASPYQSALEEILSYFRKDAITEDEYSFLLENYRETVNYIFSSFKNWAVHSSGYMSELSSWTGDFMERNGVKESDTVLLYEPGANDFAFPKCHYVVYTEENDADKALIYIKLTAIGATVEFTDNPAEDDKLMSKVNFIVCTFDVQSVRKVLPMFIKSNDSCKFLIHVGYEACHILWCDSFKKEPALGLRFKSVLYVKNAFASRLRSQRLAITLQKTDSSHVDMGIAHISNGKIQIEENKAIPKEYLHVGSMLPKYYLSTHPGTVSLSNYLDIVKGSQVQSEATIDRYLRKYKDGNVIEHTDELEDSLKSESPIKTGLPMLLTKDLSSEFADASVGQETLSAFSEEDKKEEFYLVKEPCIALCSTGNLLVAGYIKSVPESGMAVTKNIVCLSPKQELTLETGTALLLTDSISKEIEALGDGDGPISWSEDLLEMVLVPDLKKIMPSLNKLLTDTVTKQQAEIKSQYEAYQKTIHMRKHALSQNVSSLSSVFNALDAWRKRNDGAINDTDVISRVSGTTVGNAFENIKEQINDILEKVSKIAEPAKSFGKAEEIEPESFIEDFIKANKQNWLNFKPRALWEEDDEREVLGLHNEKELNSLYFSRDALTHILHNIVANACAHGFTDPSRTDYELCFNWSYGGFDLKLKISNNGTPIPEDVDKDLLKTYGFSTKLNHDGHNGAGCAEIEELMHKYGGSFEIESTPKGVTYILTFKRVSHYFAI